MKNLIIIIWIILITSIISCFVVYFQHWDEILSPKETLYNQKWSIIGITASYISFIVLKYKNDKKRY